MIKRNPHIAAFSVVTLEQAKFNQPMDMAILSSIPEDDPDLLAFLNELLRTNKPKQQNNTFWFPTPEKSCKIEDHTPIKTQTLKELYELEKKEIKPKRQHRILNETS